MENWPVWAQGLATLVCFGSVFGFIAIIVGGLGSGDVTTPTPKPQRVVKQKSRPEPHVGVRRLKSWEEMRQEALQKRQGKGD